MRLPTLVALALLLAAGLFVRVVGLADYQVSPDGALHLAIAGAPDLAAVAAHAAREVVHPPAFFLVLHALRALGDGDLYLRSVSLVPGLLLIPLAYAMLRRHVGAAAGMGAALWVTFGFAPVVLSEVIRPYALLLALLVGAIVCLAPGGGAPRGARLGGYVVLMSLAQLVHYSAVLPAVALGAAVGVGQLRARRPRPELLAWAGANAAIGAVFAGVFASLIWPLLGSATQGDATSGWLRVGYLPELSGAVLLAQGKTVFAFFTTPFHGTGPLTGIALLVAAGIVALWRGGRQPLAWATLLVVSLGIALAVLELYPFLGSRHGSYLLPFLLLAGGAALQWAWEAATSLARRKRPQLGAEGPAAWVGVALLAFVAWGGVAYVGAHESYRGLVAADEFPLRRSAFDRLVAHLEREVGERDVVLCDDQLAWYALREASIEAASPLSPRVVRVPFRGRELLCHRGHPPPHRFGAPAELHRFLAELRALGLDRGGRVWIATAGWRDSLLFSFVVPSLWPGVTQKIEARHGRRAAREYERMRESVAGGRRALLVTGGWSGGGAVYVLPWELVDGL